MNPALSGALGDIWIRLYSRFNHIGGSYNNYISMIRTVETGATEEQLGVHTSNYILLMIYDGVGHFVNIPEILGGQLLNNKWYLFELHLKSTEPQSFQVWMDGIMVLDAVPVLASTVNYIRMGLRTCGTTADFSTDQWWDGFTVSSTRIYPSSIIEIANSSDYITATKRYQEPVQLSDGSVQIKLDLTGLGSGPYYLFVTNNRQEISTSYQIGITPCQTITIDFRVT